MTTKKIGAGILAIDKHSGKILIARRGMNGGYPNTWATFGGTFEESDVNPKQTAKREFFEETGCVVDYKISREPFFLNSNRFIDFYTYLGVFDGQPEIRINEESLSYEWFHIDNLPTNIIPGMREMLDDKMPEIKRLINTMSNSNY